MSVYHLCSQAKALTRLLYGAVYQFLGRFACNRIMNAMLSSAPGHTDKVTDGLRVLVADDDPIFRSLAVSKLVHRAQDVVEVADGAAAWSRLAHEKFHLALVDLEMPHLKGSELIRCVRGHPRTRHLPVIVITSRNDSEAVRDSLEAGATSFLTKPVNWSMFGNHIDYLLRLNRISEDGRRAQEEARQTVQAITDLVADLSGEFHEAAGRISERAADTLRLARAKGADSDLIEAISAISREANRASVTMAATVRSIETAAAGTTEAPSSVMALRAAS